MNKKHLYLIFFVWLVLRIVSWNNTTLVEDHDSIHYLKVTNYFSELNFTEIKNLGPDDTYVYPFVSGIFAFLMGSPEYGTRFTSLIFSFLIFITFILIGKKFLDKDSISIGLLLFSFNPFFIPFSFSILTEPIYIGIIYYGLYLFWKNYKNTDIKYALYIGMIFGISFIVRTEGIVFLATTPFMILVYVIFNEINDKTKYIIKWTSVYIIGFMLFAIPQIYTVSSKMGTFALNGRQVWQAIFNEDNNHRYERKIYGLDYSEKELNINYLQKNPNDYKKLKTSTNISAKVKGIYFEMLKLNNEALSTFIGIFNLCFLSIGLFALFKLKKYYEIFIIFTFLFVVIVPPLMHNVDIRHIAIIAPILFLVVGKGVNYFVEEINAIVPNNFRNKIYIKTIPLMIVGIIIFVQLQPTYMAVLKPDNNHEYKIEDLKQPLKILEQDINDRKLISPKITARKNYLGYWANLKSKGLPFAEYDALVKYCKLNNIEYVFLNYKLCEEYPFIINFKEDNYNEFELLYSNSKTGKDLVELYKVKAIL